MLERAPRYLRDLEKWMRDTNVKKNPIDLQNIYFSCIFSIAERIYGTSGRHIHKCIFYVYDDKWMYEMYKQTVLYLCMSSFYIVYLYYLLVGLMLKIKLYIT